MPYHTCFPFPISKASAYKFWPVQTPVPSRCGTRIGLKPPPPLLHCSISPEGHSLIPQAPLFLQNIFCDFGGGSLLRLPGYLFASTSKVFVLIIYCSLFCLLVPA